MRTINVTVKNVEVSPSSGWYMNLSFDIDEGNESELIDGIPESIILDCIDKKRDSPIFDR